jgi:hypothetical protein
VTTTDENRATELELDRLAWNLPAPHPVESEGEREWPRPFSPTRGDDERELVRPDLER